MCHFQAEALKAIMFLYFPFPFNMGMPISLIEAMLSPCSWMENNYKTLLLEATKIFVVIFLILD